MGKTRRINLFLVLVLSIVAMLSAFFGVAVMPKNGNVRASAETVEYQDLLGVENRSWGAASDEYYFGGVTLSPYEYFNTADSVSGCWYHGNNALISANNGVDILQYIYVNEKSVREAVTENVSTGNPMVGSSGWLTNPAASPVYVETTNGSGIIIKILKAYAGDNFTLTFKAGFSLIRNDDKVIYVSDDITYNCVGNVPTKVQKSTVTFTNESGATVATKRVVNGSAIGELPAVPEKNGYGGFWAIGGTAIDETKIINSNTTATPVYGVEYEDVLGLEDRTPWGAAGGAHDGEYYFGGINLTGGYFNTATSVSTTWHADNTSIISTNSGVDIMKYIYVNGQCARDLIDANYRGGNSQSNSCSCWLSNPAAWPVYVETTNGSGIIIKVAKAYAGDSFTITFKAGFSILRSDGERVYVSNDITYTYANGALGERILDKKYTLSFDGTNVTKELRMGEAIGELPAVPAVDGYTGAWTIDGVEITADTVYNYGANKTATVVYTKVTIDLTNVLGLEDRTSWGAHDGEYYFGGINLNGGNFDTSVNGTWYVGNDALISQNNGLDIMEYIYVNGVSARKLITDNANGAANKNSCGCWMSNPAAWPVYVETTNGSGIVIKIAKAYAGDTCTIVFKKGFSIIDANGNDCVLKDNIQYTYANGALGDRVIIKEYTLSFEGLSDMLSVMAGAKIGELPAVPAVDGYKGVWTIDGVEITADTVYNYGADKTAVAQYTKIVSKNDVTDSIKIEFSSWGSTQSQFKIFINPHASLATNAWWNIDGMDDQLIAANNGVDIMNYIYVNGENIRELSDNNRNNNTYPLGNATGWFTNSDQCRPVFVETNGDGIWVQVLHSFSTEKFTVTLKAGFEILSSDGSVSAISKDVNFICENKTVTKIGNYTLTFEGAGSKTVTTNQAIGELPEVPAVDGEIPLYWAIDGVEITADTKWTYSENKTAKPVYKQKYVLSFEGISDTITLHEGDVIGTLPAVPAQPNKEGFWTIDGTKITEDFVYKYTTNKTAVAKYTDLSKDITDGLSLREGGWAPDEGEYFFVVYNQDSKLNTAASVSSTWYVGNNGVINANNGVDIMEFIYVNGVSARTLITENANGAGNKNNCGCWLSNPAAYPVYVETTTTEGILIKVAKAYAGDTVTIIFKNGFSVIDANGGVSVISEDVEFICTAGGGVGRVDDYTLTFEGAGSKTVTTNQVIGELPAVPVKDDYDGFWTIDGVEIDENTEYVYCANKTAVAAYRKDITKYFALEDRAWGAAEDEYYFGALDMRETNVVGETYYLNSSVTDTWYVGNDAIISANNGVDIMEYILINGVSARKLITDNASSSNPLVGSNGWLTNPAASPVYVETTNGSGIMIKVLKAYAGEYFEITFKSGFSLINEDGATVYLTEDVTYKYIGGTLSKGEITDAELDNFNGKQITLMNGSDVYLTKKTVQLTLPALEVIAEGAELSQVLVGWTTDPNGFSDLYPAGYKMKPANDVTLYAVWIGFDLQDGAAVRLVAGSSGIRFLTDIDSTVYQFGVEKGLITGVGTFVVPTEYLHMGKEFTHASFGEGYYVDKPTELWKVNGESDAVWTYAAAFVNISEKQFAKKLSARGYLKVQFTTGEGYVYTPYTEELNSRSIYDVALAAYNDVNNPQYKTNETILNYINKVANIVWDYETDTFARADVVGDYEITSISREDGYTVKVMVSGNVKTAIVNDVRIPESGFANFQVGEFLFSIGEFELIEGGFQFVLEAANETYNKASAETLSFKSSDADLDFFLNDFFKRHSGYVENGARDKVNSTVAGVNSEEFFSHEWMSMSYYWYNSFDGYTNEVGNNEDRIAGLRKFLSSVPVDDYGYVWSSNDRVRDPKSDVSTGEQKMGWPFPNNDTVKTAHWEFNSSSIDGWSSNISASASGGLYGKNLSNQSSNITFTSKSFSSITSKRVYTFYAPLLEFEVRIDDAANVEDIYVWYSTSSSTSFSEDKKLSVKEKAFLNYDLGNTSGAYNHVLYLPMYAESAWGESTSTYMKQLKIEIALKSGKTISGNVALNYVRPTLDTRMSNNNSILISSLRQDYDFTGDLEFLAENVTRARKAMNFLMQMYDSNRGLKRESYLVGHGGTKESLNWLGNATNQSIASSISQGYWDIMYMPEYDFQSNTYFYKAVRDMAYLESVLAENGITVTENATVKTATRNRTTGTSAYSYDLNVIADTVLANLRQTTENTNHTGFWDAADGRFVAGYASGENKWYDYGYVAWNLEAIYYGIATEEQAAAIMNWLATESNLYKYTFAPMSNTVTGDADMLNGEYAAQGDKWVNCQFGGAIMYTSFYDLMARIDTLGADNAFDRLTAIQAWYEEVYNYYVENGTDPYDFYRYYYDNKGIQCQGMGTAGAVGLDREFLESFLPVSAVAYGFFGIEANGDTLTVAPQLPADLSYWKMENLAFNFVKYDLTIYENAIQLNNVRGDAAGLTLTVALDYEAGQSVYVNGKKLQSGYTVENGKVFVTVAMGATIVEVR